MLEGTEGELSLCRAGSLEGRTPQVLPSGKEDPVATEAEAAGEAGDMDISKLMTG